MSVIFNSDQTVWFVGGRGDQSGRVTDAGGCTKTWWDAECPNDTDAEKTAAMAKLMTSTGAPIITRAEDTYTERNNRITGGGGVYANAEVGMVAYVIESPVPEMNVETGRYKITAVDPSGNWIECSSIDGSDADVDVNVGGAFYDLDQAIDETSATSFSVMIYTNLDELLSTSVSISAGGYQPKNTFKRVVGYNTVPGDMKRGGAYYEPAYEILQNGSIDLTKCVTVDGQGGAFSIFSFGGGADNFVFENLHLTGTTAKAITYSSISDTLLFHNCRFSDCVQAVNDAADRQVFLSCYTHNDLVNHSYVLRGEGNALIGCVAKHPATDAVFTNIIGTQALVFGCVSVGAMWGIRPLTGSSAIVIGNTFYDTYQYGILLDSNGSVVAHNNIFAMRPSAGAVALHISAGGASFLYNDYNCFIETDGTPLTVGENLYSGGEAPTTGEHSLAVDPLFVDAASYNFTLANESPCIDAGRADSLGGRSTIGAYDLSANRGVSKARVIGGV